MFDIKNLKSHPDKLLSKHLEGVMNNVRQLTNSKKTELVAVWHDLGKCNPNFQKKLLGGSVKGYDKHSYISAFALFCAIVFCKKNKDEAFDNYIDMSSLTSNELLALVAIIAKHHGDLPDFMPNGDRTVLNSNEIDDLYSFIDGSSIKLNEVVMDLMKVPDFSVFTNDSNIRRNFKERLVFKENANNSLHFFCDVQKTFAALILSDKLDAAGYYLQINDDRVNVNKFSESFCETLDGFLGNLRADTELNRLRTAIRCDAVKNISLELNGDKHVFELTSPTGSGKTMMLLSLASEIIKRKGSKRVIYALPFLSITEQVEKIVHEIFVNHSSDIRRIDSKADNSIYDKRIEDAESEATEEIDKVRNQIDFMEQTFAYPFIITTFVRFFETLMSNRNSELLKLPNFSNCIFLLDEIQTLPPRLYGFFVAYLDYFCRENNSYAIVSTATQPKFDLPNNPEISEFFSSYTIPSSLLPLDYFSNEVFNRYVINYRKDGIEVDALADELSEVSNSVLVILNTIDDTKQLYDLLSEKCSPDVNLCLLNTHFTTEDRKKKIADINGHLKRNDRIVVVSTQLVEAGVDIDFPVVYRDMTIVSSIVQSAGRCNRNGRMSAPGIVNLINLTKDGKSRSELIFRGKDRELLRFTKEALCQEQYAEKDLLTIQNEFFSRIQSELNFGVYNICKQERNFIKDMKQCMYEQIGKFSLIDKYEFGDVRQYYVPKSEEDDAFERLMDLSEHLSSQTSMEEVMSAKRNLRTHLRSMQNRVVQIRLKKNDYAPIPVSEKEYFGLQKLALEDYSYSKGVNLSCESIL